jgi:hypothetical protein
MITRNYNLAPMTDLAEGDYETLLTHLSEQVASCVGGDPDYAHNAASDALTNTWQPEMTARDWLAAAGKRLDVDTSRCVGV